MGGGEGVSSRGSNLKEEQKRERERRSKGAREREREEEEEVIYESSISCLRSHVELKGVNHS